jgi:hypothetical protein
MEFLAIMFVGTVIAVWAVCGSSRSKSSRVSYLPPVIPPEINPQKPPAIWQYEPIDQAEYNEALDRHLADPMHNPLPSALEKPGSFPS